MAEAAAPSVEETKDPTNIDFEMDKLDELLSDVGPVLPAIPADDARLIALVKVVRTNEIRDATFSTRTFGLIYDLLIFGWRNPTTDMRMKLLYIFTKVVALPEFDVQAAGSVPTPKFLECLFQQAGGMCVTETEHPYLKQIIFWCYDRFPQLRVSLRKSIGQCLKNFLLIANRAVAVVALLEVLTHIIEGFQKPLLPHHEQLLREVILPLHTVNRTIGGRGGALPTTGPGGASPTHPMGNTNMVDGQPLLSLYHHALVRCELQMFGFDKSFAVECVKFILDTWPEQRAGVSAKEVLLLHEIEKLMEHFNDDDMAGVLPALLPRLISSISGDFAMIAQRALQYWKNENFVKLTLPHTKRMLPPIMVACYRGHKPHWNATVNRLSATVLDTLRRQDPETFSAMASTSIPRLHQDYERKFGGRRYLEKRNSLTRESPTPAMPDPTKRRSIDHADAAAAATSPKAQSNLKSSTKWAGGADQPPATITGVAPWASKSPPPTEDGPDAASMAIPEDDVIVEDVDSAGEDAAVPGIDLGGDLTSVSEDVEDSEVECGWNVVDVMETDPSAEEATLAAAAEDDEGGGSEGLTLVQAFITKHRTEAKQHDKEMNSMAETPTLLPTLKFHHLVWGHDLGSGAFSTVKYAKHITRGTPNADWPEYAVKLISISKIQEQGYEFSLAREISILRVMSHPGISRLVADFRWRDGAYLVLEYAAKGDLHSYITKNGSLNEPSARFICGEVLAAIASVHSKGFVFADLKPENVVLTEGGHAKVADFGAARPLSAAAIEVTNKGKAALRELRDGDHKWRQGHKKYIDTESEIKTDEDAPPEPEEDSRVEGTAAYLAPEVAMGGQPSYASDCWALGCLLYQCLAGRPPIWAETAQETMASIVQFSANRDIYPDTFPPTARGLVSALLEPKPEARLTLEAAAAHPFFEGMDVFQLYQGQAPELAVGSVEPAPDAKWARRQNSMLWQPMPQEFSAAPSAGTGPGHSIKFKTIAEGPGERDAPFLSRFGAVRE